MAETYKSRHGIDWPPEWSDILIDLTVAKKHRFIERDYGVRIKDPWEPFIQAAQKLVPPPYFIVSPWTEEHFHDFTMYEEVITWGCASSSKSNDYGFMLLLDWIVDPYSTVTIIGSTTKIDLRIRIWESIVRYHEALKNNDQGFIIPGLVSEVGFAISNTKEDGTPESAGKKAAILGRALNEDGRLQGAHLTFVRALVDELATISNYEALDLGIGNLSIAEDFRFYGLANPKSWDDPSCKYCMPKDGQRVDVDTGSWMSTRGIFVRHHDGLKSPAYLDPTLEKKFPFLMSRRHVEKNLARSDGNWDSRLIWEQVRGFPLSVGNTAPTVLDPLVASANKIGSPAPQPFAGTRRRIGKAAGVDPAWSEKGDDAVYAGSEVFEQDGRVMIDFSGRVRRMPIKATSTVPITQQQRDFVLQAMQQDGGPGLKELVIDASGNQGLADSIAMYVGPGALPVNNSQRASDAPVKKTDPREAREFIKDRGTEAWLVLAEFCRAGQVFGLPEGAVAALTSRRFATRAGSSEPLMPLRLESKEDFARRFHGSPNETDACALNALGVKERLGILPFGGAPDPVPQFVVPEAYGGTTDPALLPGSIFGEEPDEPGAGYTDGFGDGFGGPGGYGEN